MYKIGEFSKLSKTTIKTLRYYEQEGLLIPTKIDKFTGYRYYDSSKLLDLSKIVALRQVGLSIQSIKSVLLNNSELDLTLKVRKSEISAEIDRLNRELSRINGILNCENNEKIFLKQIPEYIVYYKEGELKEGNFTKFILDSAQECLELNPNIKCVEPDYCFTYILDSEYRDKNLKIGYAQAVTNFGKENDNIKFKKLNSVEAVSIYHKGSYDTFSKSYSILIKWIEDNGYKVIEPIREMYIDGIWNKNREEDYLTEIQAPVVKIKE